MPWPYRDPHAPARPACAPHHEFQMATGPLILPTIDASIRSGLDALFNRLGIRPKIAAEVDYMAMIRLLARGEVGLAIVPPIVVEDELENASLVEVDRLSGLHEVFHAIAPRRRFPNPLLADLLQATHHQQG